MRKKILFVVEALTFAHVARSAVLAQILQAANYEVHFACYPDAYLERVKAELNGCRHWPLKSRVEYGNYIASMNACHSPYNVGMLESFIREELDLFDQVKPDIVIGDLRYSLSISCLQARIRYVNLISAVWSPFVKQQLTFPEGFLPWQLGIGTRDLFFRILHSFAFRNICRPFNILRSRFGLPEFKDIFDLHCAGDINLYLDPPELFEVRDLPGSDKFIGPVLFSIDTPVPPELEGPQPLPIVFVSLGSSGPIDCLPVVLRTLTQLPVLSVVATSGRMDVNIQHPSLIIREFLPARSILQRSSLVISNGGSPMSYLALSEGVPIIAVCSNMDQHLISQSITKYGAGMSLRSENLDERTVKDAVNRCFGQPMYRDSAQRCSKFISAEKTARNFRDAINDIISSGDEEKVRYHGLQAVGDRHDY